METTFDISIAGVPIGGLDRITPETVRALKAARIILDLTSYHWPVKRFCKHVVDLDKEYWTGELDEDVYVRIADIVLKEASKGPSVVLVVDGHPGIYQDLSWDICQRGKRRGLKVRMLPALSCFDAMIALCGIEIGPAGIQIFEATSIVGFGTRINPFIDMLVMQIGWFGTSLLSPVAQNKKGRFELLIRHLTKYYPEKHRVKILKVPFSVDETPSIITTRLSSLDRYHKRICGESTLFIPALDSSDDECVNEEFLVQTEDKGHLVKIAELEND